MPHEAQHAHEKPERNDHDQPLKKERTAMGAKINNATIVNNNTKRILAMKKHVTSSTTEIPIGGELLQPAQVIAVYQNSLDSRATVTAMLAGYKAALVERARTEAKLGVTEDALKGWVLNRFGVDSAEALEFGFSPRKKAEVSAADRANAVLLGHATRKARGTMGKKKRLKIKGTRVVPDTSKE